MQCHNQDGISVLLHDTLHRLELSQCLSAEDRSCLSQKTEVNQGNIGRANCGAAYNIVDGVARVRRIKGTNGENSVLID